MRISRINSFVSPKVKNNAVVKKQNNIQSNFDIKTSTNIFKNYALPQITFKGDDDFSQPPTYESLRCDVSEDESINQARHKVFDKFVSDPLFYTDPKLRSDFCDRWAIDHVLSDEEADVKIAILDKFANDEKWQQSEFVNENKAKIYQNVNYPNLLQIIDRYVTEPKLSQNEALGKKISAMIFNCYRQNSESPYETNLRFLDKFLSDPKLYDNEKLNASLVDIWGFQHRIPIMDKYITDERWNTNKDLEDLFINLLHNVHFPDKENARNPIIDIILEKPDLYKEEQQQANIITILNQTINPVQAPIAEKLLSAPEFLKNKLGSDTKVFTIGDKQVIDAELVILDKILSEPKLRNNESIQKNLPNVLYDNEYDVEKSLNAKLSVIDKYLSNDDLSQIDAINDNLGSIIWSASNPVQADVINCIFSDKNLYEDPMINEKICYLSCGITVQKYPALYKSNAGRIETVRKLEENKDKYDKENLSKLFRAMNAYLWNIVKPV